MAKFVKGATGNPGGRPKGSVDVRALARSHTKAAIDRLFEIMQRGTSETAQIAAANSLLDRGWGKPTQPFVSDSTVTATVKIDARAALLATLARIAATEGEGGGSSENEPGGGRGVADPMGIPRAA